MPLSRLVALTNGLVLWKSGLIGWKRGSIRIEVKIDRLEVQIANISGRMQHLPTAWMMVVTIIGSQISLVGLMVAIGFGTLRMIGHKLSGNIAPAKVSDGAPAWSTLPW